MKRQGHQEQLERRFDKPRLPGDRTGDQSWQIVDHGPQTPALPSRSLGRGASPASRHLGPHTRAVSEGNPSARLDNPEVVIEILD